MSVPVFTFISSTSSSGLPKEIEEAALVDGCGVWYTYFRIMLINAMPAVITVAVFSIVWQFNDTFYAKLFLISEDVVISKKISSLQAVIANVDKILDTTIQELYLDAGIVLINPHRILNHLPRFTEILYRGCGEKWYRRLMSRPNSTFQKTKRRNEEVEEENFILLSGRRHGSVFSSMWRQNKRTGI